LDSILFDLKDVLALMVGLAHGHEVVDVIDEGDIGENFLSNHSHPVGFIVAVNEVYVVHLIEFAFQLFTGIVEGTTREQILNFLIGKCMLHVEEGYIIPRHEGYGLFDYTDTTVIG
jgi:hypothetical protein